MVDIVDKRYIAEVEDGELLKGQRAVTARRPVFLEGLGVRRGLVGKTAEDSDAEPAPIRCSY